MDRSGTALSGGRGKIASASNSILRWSFEEASEALWSGVHKAKSAIAAGILAG